MANILSRFLLQLCASEYRPFYGHWGKSHNRNIGSRTGLAEIAELICSKREHGLAIDHHFEIAVRIGRKHFVNVSENFGFGNRV